MPDLTKDTPLVGPAEWRTVLLIVVATFVVHGLLLVNDGVYWDGHLIYTYLRDRNSAELWSTFSDAGAPYTAAVHWALGQSAHFVVVYKLAMFTALLAAAVGIWRLALESGHLTNDEAASIAILAMAYPGYRAGVELIEAPDLIAYACFFWAAWLDLRATRRDDAWAIIMHLLAGMLFVASFVMPSLMTMFVAYVAFATMTSRTKWMDWCAWCLPVIAAIAGQWLFRPRGAYAGYNAISLSPNAALTEVAWFLRYAIYGAVNRALAGALAQPLLVIGGLLVGYGMMAAMRAAPAALPQAGSRTLAFAILVFGLAVGPYAVVGKHPLLDGWTTRHALLMGLPVAIALVALGSILERRRLLRPGVRDLALAAVAIAFGLSMVQSYLGWQARWVKDASVMSNLARTAGAQRYAVFIVDDEFPAGGEPRYRPYEWSSMFRRVWGDQTHAAVFADSSAADLERAIAPLKSASYNLADVDPLGCEANLTIRRGRQATDDLTMTITYTYTRLFRPERLAGYLGEVSSVDVTPHVAPAAAHCR